MIHTLILQINLITLTGLRFNTTFFDNLVVASYGFKLQFQLKLVFSVFLKLQLEFQLFFSVTINVNYFSVTVTVMSVCNIKQQEASVTV